MRVSVGIDLGSTTCKAVVLNERAEIVGKGITNTRSNYEMATKIATHAALTNARFALLGEAAGLTEEERANFELLYHREDYLHKQQGLSDCLLRLAGEKKKRQWEATLAELGQYVRAVLTQPENLAVIGDVSRFFRDLMYRYYMEGAEKLLPRGDLDVDAFLGLLDKALVIVDNDLFPLEPDSVLPRLLPDEKREVAEKMMRGEINVAIQVGTGYGRQLLPFPEEQIRSEILCHARGAHHSFPDTRTVLDIGGQDTKAIQLDDDGIVRSFFMNDRCAAGCGRYLGYVADELAIGLSDLGPTACRACHHLPISSTCTVFAGAELRDLLYAGEQPEEILLGLHRAIVLRAMSLLARSGGIYNQFTFTGGVAKNEAVRMVLGQLVDQKYGDEIQINLHPDSIYMGALGAALYGRDQV